jgi:lipopolysaccharide export system protein LptA
MKWMAVLLGAVAWLGACAGPELAYRRALPGSAVAAPPALPVAPTPTPAPDFPQSAPLDVGSPVKLRAGRLRHDQGSHTTVFYGGVTVTHDTSTLVAAELRSRDQGRSAQATGGVAVTDTRRRFYAEAGGLDYTDALRRGRLYGGVRLVTVEPYGRSVTITGAQGGYEGLSRVAWIDGGVLVLREGLSLTAGRAEVDEGQGLLTLWGDVDVILRGSRARAQGAVLRQDGQSLELSGTVRARFVPAELRQEAERPWQDGVWQGRQEGKP